MTLTKLDLNTHPRPPPSHPLSGPTRSSYPTPRRPPSLLGSVPMGPRPGAVGVAAAHGVGPREGHNFLVRRGEGGRREGGRRTRRLGMVMGEGGGWGGGAGDREVKRRSYICLNYPSARSPQRPSVLYHVNATRVPSFFLPSLSILPSRPSQNPIHTPPPRPLNHDPFFFKYSLIREKNVACA